MIDMTLSWPREMEFSCKIGGRFSILSRALRKKATFFSSLKAAKHEMILISIHHYKFACSINWTFLLCQFDFFHG